MRRQVHPSVSRLQMCTDINQMQYTDTELRPGSQTHGEVEQRRLLRC